MFSRLDEALGLAGNSPLLKGGELMLVRELNGGEASFMIASSLCQALKDKCNVVLISLLNSDAHYRVIAAKYGLNLRDLEGKGRFRVVSPYRDVCTSSGDLTPKPWTIDDCLADLQRCISQLDEASDEGVCERLCVFIDDLTVLQYLTPDQGAIQHLVLHAQACAEQRNGYTVVLIKDSALADELHSMADLTVDERPLKSGISKAIHGELIVRFGVGKAMEAITAQRPSSRDIQSSTVDSLLGPRHLHFKSTEFGVSYFPPGTIVG
eukprot:Clim_evm15s196 gene=Clim_evmTU15s196